MRCLLTFVAAAVVTSGFVYGDEPQQPNEHLKGYGPFIGNWRYEGPVLADVPELAEKGSKCVVDFSWRWILDKQVVMHDWLVEFEGGTKLSGKALIGWNAADKTIVRGQMHSSGGMRMGTVVLDRETKTITYTSEGTDEEGVESSSKTVVTKTDKDTLTWQAVERTGGDVEGESPVYTLKRVKRTKGKTTANSGQVLQQLRGYGPFLGTWRYEGPLGENDPGFGDEDSTLVFQFTWRRILDKSVVLEEWSLKYASGMTFSGKALIGWNAADKQIVYRGMDLGGGMSLGTVVFDGPAKSSTLTEEGITGKGAKTTFKGVVTKTGKDTLAWQALERTGYGIDGPSPVYEFKRVKRTKGKKTAK